MATRTLSPLAVNLKRIRKDRKLTQRGLADLTGLSVATIYLIEQDRRPNPTFPTLRRLASALGARIGEITG